MKPVYLEFCGLNSFSEKAQIDFNALLSGGVFGIFGDTGSGKSTILDAVHFALYGEVDRVPKSFNDCINYRSETASVIFDFEITTDGKRNKYRVKRERKRKAGSTKAWLYRYTTDNGLFPLAETPSEVNEKIEEIVGLTFSDFKTCIALPQGDFAALVKATPADRVKLVSRLFDLEKYGERLSRAVNDKYRTADEAVQRLEERMRENEAADEKRLNDLIEEWNGQKARLAVLEEQHKITQDSYTARAELCKRKKRFEEVKSSLLKMEKDLPNMRELRTALEKYTVAKTVIDQLALAEKNKADSEKAKRNAENSESSLARYQKELGEYSEKFEKADYSKRLIDISVKIETVKNAQSDMQEAKKAKADLDACIESYRAIKDKCPFEDFDKKTAELQEKIDELGNDLTLLDYLKRTCKDIFLADAYGEFRVDLRTISDKYPQTQADVQTLLQKYTLPMTDETDRRAFDIANVNIAFKENERKKKNLQAELQALQKREMDYNANENQKKLLQEQGKILRQNYESLQAKTETVRALGSEETLVKEKTALESLRDKAQSEIETARENITKAQADASKYRNESELYANAYTETLQSVGKLFSENGLANETEARAVLDRVRDERNDRMKTNSFFEEYAALKREYDNTDGNAFSEYDEEKLASLEIQKKTEENELFELNRKIGANEKELDRLKTLREKYKEQEKELAGKIAERKVCDELRLLVRSNRFLEYIASEYLQEISVRAGKTLLSLTGGRYFLRYDKDFKVGDNFDGGEMRAVKTLSGGETFLVSLSLALSLSTAICAKSLRPIEFFFLDEGFGTLDDKLVETVMDVLGKLSKTFAVGLISHVEELKRRIDNKVLVTGADGNNGSSVQVVTLG